MQHRNILGNTHNVGVTRLTVYWVRAGHGSPPPPLTLDTTTAAAPTDDPRALQPRQLDSQTTFNDYTRVIETPFSPAPLKKTPTLHTLGVPREG